MSNIRLEGPPSLNDPGSWSSRRHRLLWVLAALATAALAWTFWVEGEYARWVSEREREAVLRDEFSASVQRIRALPSLQARKQQLEEDLGRLQKQLPAATEMDGLLRGITAAGRVRGLQFELFRPGPIQLREAYAEIPVAVRVVGGYHDIGLFLGDLARLPRIVTLHNVSLLPQAQLINPDRSAMPGTRLLVMEATLRTYRALDAQEAAQLKRRPERAAATEPAPASAGGSSR